MSDDGEVPDWEDEYLDRVSDRLAAHYDLERDYAVRGERFPLYGRMEMRSQKHFLHPALSYAHHESTEHLFARRVDAASRELLEGFVELGHDLAEAWIEPDAEHYSTDFTFVALAPSVPEDVASFVEGFRDRNLLALGYHGHYEVNLAVAAPDRERLAASRGAHVGQAFRLWEELEPERGPLRRLVDRLRSLDAPLERS